MNEESSTMAMNSESLDWLAHHVNIYLTVKSEVHDELTHAAILAVLRAAVENYNDGGGQDSYIELGRAIDNLNGVVSDARTAENKPASPTDNS